MEKLDFLAIIYAIIVCVFALFMMHGWPKFLEEDTLTSWLTAIGTIGAALGAVVIATLSRIFYKLDEKNKAKRYLLSARIDIKQVYESLKAIELERFDRNYQVQDRSYGETIAIQQIARFSRILRAVDVITLAIASKEIARKVLLSQDILVTAMVEINQTDANVLAYKKNINLVKNELGELLDILDNMSFE